MKVKRNSDDKRDSIRLKIGKAMENLTKTMNNCEQQKEFSQIEIDKNLDNLPQDESIFKEKYEHAKEVLTRLNDKGELEKLKMNGDQTY